MAILLNGILGKAHNKVGNVIAASWKGINYVREYVIPANPNTVAQQTQRGYVALEGKCASSMLLPICQKFWDPIARSMSGFNMMVGTNLKILATAGKELKDTVRSSGTLEGTTISSATYFPSTGIINIAFSSDVLGNGLPTDKVVAVVYDKANKVSFVDDGTNTRTDASSVFGIGAGRTVTNLVAWIFFYRGTSAPYVVSTSVGTNVSAE